MISCEQALELISLELDGLLDDTGREQLERHLAGCAPCQALREELLAGGGLLRRMEADALRFKIMRNREGDTVGVLQLSNAMDGEGAVRPFA